MSGTFMSAITSAMDASRVTRDGLILVFLISVSTGTPVPSETIDSEVHHQRSIPESETANEKLIEDSIIIPHPELLNPLYIRNVPYEESLMHPMSEDLKAIIDTIDNLESNMEPHNSESDGKNLGHLIDLLEEIKRRIDLFKKDVAEILGPLHVIGGNHRIHHHRHQFAAETSETESTISERPVTEDKPNNQNKPPAKPEISIEEKPEVPSKDKKPARPGATSNTEVVNETEKTEIKKTEVEKKKPTKNETPIKIHTEKNEPTKTDAPTKTEKLEEKPGALDDSTITDLGSKISNVRSRRSPYRGFGGPYYGGGNYGGLGYGNSYRGGIFGGLFGGNRYGGYGSGYPYYINNGGWRPLNYG